MSSETDTSADHGARIARITWIVSFVIPAVVLLVLLLAAKPSEAITPLPPQTGLIQEGEEEEGETPEETGEEAEEEELETASDSSTACSLRSASAHAVARHQRLKLTVGYTAYEPVNARVEIHSGGVQIGSVKRHLGRSGVLRITKKLGEQQQAKRLVIRFLISGCDSFPSKTIRVH